MSFSQFEEYIQAVITPLLRSGHPIDIRSSQDSMGVLLVVLVHPRDFALLIGVQGKTIQALRTLLRILGSQYEIAVSLKILKNSVYSE